MKRFTLLSSAVDSVRAVSSPKLSPLLPIFFLFGFSLSYAQSPGSPAADLIGEQSVSESALGGTLLAMQPSPASLFGNPALLTDIRHSGISLSWRRYSTFEKSYEAIGAVRLDGDASFGFGVSFSGVSPIDYRDASERTIGEGSSGTLVVGAGGSVGIGPGSLGGAIRLLSYSAQDVEASGIGFAVDLGASLTFRERLHLALLLRNLGGVMNATYRDGVHETIPVDSRLGASYRFPLERSFTDERNSPIGIRDHVEGPPSRYVLAGLEVRSAAFDDRLILAGSIEVLPFLYSDESAVGFRAGVNSRGEIGGGFFLDVPLNDYATASRISFGYRHSPTFIGNGLFFALDFSP